jgi:glycosyltransferase involved in cell wall biosynthesis
MKRSIPLVSVVIPAYEAEATIAATIASVLKQTFERFEIIVVDDGSRDATSEVVQAIADPRIRLHRSRRNRGRCWARNQGVELARADVLACLDADDLYAPSFMEACLQKLQRDPECDAVSTGLRLPAPVHPTWYHNLCFTLPSNKVFRRGAFMAVGGFVDDPAFRAYGGGEDLLFSRLIQQYFNVGFIARRLCTYTERPGNMFDRQRERFAVEPGHYVANDREERAWMHHLAVVQRHFLAFRERVRGTLLGRPARARR